MMKRLIRKSVPRDQWHQYYMVAGENYKGALNNYENELWTPAAILFIHTVIAYTDALTIKAGAVKSSGDDHLQVVSLVKQLIFITDEDQRALTRLMKILGEKSKVAYGGQVYSRNQAEKMMKNMESYQSWIIDKIASLA